ncbi:MAG: metallophosphoesterase [Petrimonas sp.]|nr:metallophosphoesterase [Petrimonas sp.]
MRKFILFLTLFFSLTASASGPLKIGVISDIHFLSKELTAQGDALAAYEGTTGRNIRDSHEVLDSVLLKFQKERIDILLISGDLTNHGERQSHLDLIEKLKSIQRNGTKVFVVPGNHDVNIPDSKAYTGEKPVLVKSISREEFAEWYAPFGYGNALKRDDSSLSYIAEINENTWLLCFDTNRYAEYKTTSISGGRILPSTMDWALDILREAKAKNITVLGMMHHGLVEHMPYQSTFFAEYLIEEWEKNAGILADAGLKVMFTGHFHSNDISLFTSPSGNTIYDVETASLAIYPFAYRTMELIDGKLSIDTHFVTSVSGNPDLAAQSRSQLETVTRRVAKNRIKNLGVSFPVQTEDALVKLIVKMNLMHVRGDEAPDEEMKEAIREFAGLLDSEEIDSDFQLDFPPTDNRLVIDLTEKVF